MARRSEAGGGGLIGTVVKLGIVGGIGYYLYEKYATSATAVLPSGTVTDTSASPNGGTAIAPPPPPVTSAATTATLVKKAATDHGFTFGTVDQWDYYLNQVRGEGYAPDPISDWHLTNTQRGTNMTFDEWWALAQKNGLSGLFAGVSGLNGLGMVLDLGDFFTATPHRRLLQGNFR